MREVSFVNKLTFKITGSVTKNALVIGDADNDKQNELVCATLQGELAIFKGTNSTCIARATNLGMVTACVIGDVKNIGKNQVVAINTEGWLYVFDAPSGVQQDKKFTTNEKTFTQNDRNEEYSASNQSQNYEEELETRNSEIKILQSNYQQRMPANAKVIMLADLDGDGLIEVVIGLTDRVLRTYRWVKVGDMGKGKLVGIYKWEFADQIGAVSLNPSDEHENCLDVIVAQPGGTYARLECLEKRPSPTESTEATTESGSILFNGQAQQHQPEEIEQLKNNNNEDNVQTEYIWKLTPEYHQLSLAQMRNPHISTEIIGGIKGSKKRRNHSVIDSNGQKLQQVSSNIDLTNADDCLNQPNVETQSNSLIVISTLDGTLMLVNKDEVLWSMQVDHQLFASAKLDLDPINDDDDDPTRNMDRYDRSSQYFIACAWDGKTYIIDERRNYLRFKFSEAVSAFTAGNFYFDGRHHPSIVYATFQSKIILYYDIELKSIRPRYILNEVMTRPYLSELRAKLIELASKWKLSDESESSYPLDSAAILRKTISRILYREVD